MLISLRLVTFEDFNSYESISLLKKWRIANKAAYVGDYKVTYSSMKFWLLNSVLSDTRRFLFWVLADKKRIGHIGIKNLKPSSVEIDNVIRGEKAKKGAMHEALKILMSAYPEKRIWLRVLPENTHAIEFYKRNGFKITGKKSPFLVMTHE